MGPAAPQLTAATVITAVEDEGHGSGTSVPRQATADVVAGQLECMDTEHTRPPSGELVRVHMYADEQVSGSVVSKRYDSGVFSGKKY